MTVTQTDYVLDELRSLTPHLRAEAVDVATALYSLGSNPAESSRLVRQSDELAPWNAELLDRVDLKPGQAAIDLGCGPRGVVELLSERVTPGGRVVGLDADPVHVAMAKAFAEERKLGNVEIIAADAAKTGLLPGTFDLVHARTLLVNVPNPAAVVAEMARLARPGGWVASLEPDCEYCLCHPSHPAVDRIGELFDATFRRNGADPFIGRRLGELYRQAGLDDIGFEVKVGAHPAGHSRRTIRLDLVASMRPMIVEMGLADDTELKNLDRDARQHLADPNTIMIFGVYFLVWGHKRHK